MIAYYRRIALWVVLAVIPIGNAYAELPVGEQLTEWCSNRQNMLYYGWCIGYIIGIQHGVSIGNETLNYERCGGKIKNTSPDAIIKQIQELTSKKFATQEPAYVVVSYALANICGDGRGND
jgi:hypothetical protein